MKAELKFTDEHVEKIRNGEKHTTMRTIKKDHFYPVGSKVIVPDADNLVLEITDMAIVRFGKEYLRPVHCPKADQDFLYLDDGDQGGVTLWPRNKVGGAWEHNNETALDRLAKLEGFEDHEEMVGWFQGENPMGLTYNLPQNFFLYRFRVVA